MKRVKSQAINRALLQESALMAWRKLMPANMIKNPVMFLVWVGTLITAALAFRLCQTTEFLPLDSDLEQALIEAAVLTSLKDPTPEGKSVLKLAESLDYECPMPTVGAEFIPFSTQTRLSGVRLADGRHYVKGARDAVVRWVESHDGAVPAHLNRWAHRIAQRGSTPLVVTDTTGVLGVIKLSDVIKPGVAKRFAGFGPGSPYFPGVRIDANSPYRESEKPGCNRVKTAARRTYRRAAIRHPGPAPSQCVALESGAESLASRAVVFDDITELESITSHDGYSRSTSDRYS